MSYGDALASEVRTDGNVAVMSSGGATGRHDRANTRAPAIVVGRKGSHGSLWWSDSPVFVIDTAYSIDSSNTRSNLRWLYYALCTLGLDSLSNDVGVPGLSREAAYGELVPIVDREEQRRIADFLDDRITRIDQIITARRHQTNLLWEVLSSGITRIIDRTEGAQCSLWLMTEQITDGAHVSPETAGGTYDFVSTRDLNATGTIDFSGSLKTSPASYATLVRQGCRPVPGDVLFSKDGTVGRTARVTSSRDFVVASSLIIVRPRPERLDFNYLHYLFKHAKLVHQVESFVKGAGLPRISIANLRRVVGVFPSLSIQKAIADCLDRESANTNSVAGALDASVARLAEYKQSLITAAVTGELDVTTAGSGIPT
ncbi:MAG: restriction endonuclease subunit S [Nocardioides sp.]